MKVKASLKYLHISPRKVRMVANLIKGMEVKEAEIQLQFLPQRVAKTLLKLLNSAVASAKHDFDIDKKNLYISKIITNEGPTLKRWRARARGVASPIMKRTSHVILELEEKIPTKKTRKKAVTKIRKEVTTTPQKEVETPTDEVKRPQVKERPKKKEFLGKIRLKQLGKKIFRRKSI